MMSGLVAKLELKSVRGLLESQTQSDGVTAAADQDEGFMDAMVCSEVNKKRMGSCRHCTPKVMRTLPTTLRLYR